MMLWWTSGHDVPLETARERDSPGAITDIRSLDDQPAGGPDAGGPDAGGTGVAPSTELARPPFVPGRAPAAD
jgi:hypothetical protein